MLIHRKINSTQWCALALIMLLIILFILLPFVSSTELMQGIVNEKIFLYIEPSTYGLILMPIIWGGIIQVVFSIITGGLLSKKHIFPHRNTFQNITHYVAADTHFSKITFVDRVPDKGFRAIRCLQEGASTLYLSIKMASGNRASLSNAVRKSIISNIVILTVVCITSFSCKPDKPSTEIEKVIKEWTGKKINFPQGVRCISMNKDTTCISPDSTPYKILIYIDQAGCISNKLQLYKWNTLIEEVRNEMQGLVNFQFYFQPKDIRKIQSILRRDTFEYPSHIDIDGKLNKLNNFQEDSRFQTFLLDMDNKVVLVGNPVNNPHIWDLYKRIIKREKNISVSNQYGKHSITSLKVEKQILELESLKTGKTTTASFMLKNTGNNPLIIAHVSTTCGCTVPEWSKEPILPNKTTEITVQVTPSDKGYFRKAIKVYCNIKNRNIILVISGMVES